MKKPSKAKKKAAKPAARRPVQKAAMSSASITAADAARIGVLMERRTNMIAFVAAMRQDNSTNEPFAINGPAGPICVLMGDDATAARAAAADKIEAVRKLVDINLRSLGVDIGQPEA